MTVLSMKWFEVLGEKCAAKSSERQAYKPRDPCEAANSKKINKSKWQVDGRESGLHAKPCRTSPITAKDCPLPSKSMQKPLASMS